MKTSNRLSKLFLTLILVGLLFNQFASAQNSLNIDRKDSIQRVDFPFGCPEVRERFQEKDLEWLIMPYYSDLSSDPEPDSLKFLTNCLSKHLFTLNDNRSKSDSAFKIPKNLTFVDNGINYWFLREPKPQFNLGTVKYQLPNVGPYELFYCAGVQLSENDYSSRVYFGNLLVINKHDQTAKYLNVYCERPVQWHTMSIFCSVDMDREYNLEVHLYEERSFSESYISCRYASKVVVSDDPDEKVAVDPMLSTHFYLPFGCPSSQISSDQLVQIQKPENENKLSRVRFLSDCFHLLNQAPELAIDIDVSTEKVNWIDTGIEMPIERLDTLKDMLLKNIKYQLPSVGDYSCFYSFISRVREPSLFFQKSDSIEKLLEYGSLIFYSEESESTYFIPIYADLKFYESTGLEHIRFSIDEDFKINLYKRFYRSDKYVESLCDIEIDFDPDGLSFTIEPATN